MKLIISIFTIFALTGLAKSAYCDSDYMVNKPCRHKPSTVKPSPRLPNFDLLSQLYWNEVSKYKGCMENYIQSENDEERKHRLNAEAARIEYDGFIKTVTEAL